ncbi:MAG: ABC transporter ATP-binding protein [Bacillota bacterium]|nr:ABC transporter ATP-binding protein [Bacillota bacterium]
MKLLKIDNLQKSFGSNKVLNGLSFDVEEGDLLGFIGQNGAGKTTTMKIILGLLAQDGGTVRFNGQQVRYGNTATNKNIGYLPDVPAFYDYMRPLEYLRLCGEISHMEKAHLPSRCAELLELVGLSDAKGKISGFSRGMKQRLGIAQALLSRPKLLLCDEPTSALDPAGRKEVLDILAQITGNTTVLFSTHVLSDVERICNKAVLLHQGKTAFCGRLQDVKGRRRHDTILIRFEDSASAAELVRLLKGLYAKGTDLLSCDPASHATLADSTVRIRTPNMARAEANLFKLMASRSLLPAKVEIEEPTLESVFLEVIG